MPNYFSLSCYYLFKICIFATDIQTEYEQINYKLNCHAVAGSYGNGAGEQ